MTVLAAVYVLIGVAFSVELLRDDLRFGGSPDGAAFALAKYIGVAVAWPLIMVVAFIDFQRRKR